jgi:hypothetical protein
LAGILILLAGLALNHFYGQKGKLLLEAGKENTLITNQDTTSGGDSSAPKLGLAITLDTVILKPHTPEYELRLLKRDTTVAAHHGAMSGSTFSTLTGVFPLEQMKIRVVEKTDLRFRLKEFYPNFEFAYEYPANRDSIAAKAPGITLELKTREGTPIVTLRSDQPNKNKLGDIVSLGASLFFYWDIPMDSIKAIADDHSKPGNKIVFSGADHKIFFILNDSITEKPLQEKTFYAMPGQDSVGFTIIYCFPDIALLKAVPSTRGTDLLNPVAHVEIWKEGQGAIDAFVYPESRVRKGGEFEIPGSVYRIGLGIDPAKEMPYCDCSISARKDGSETPEVISFVSGKSMMYKGYRFRPVKCLAGVPGKVTMEIEKMPGRNLVIGGIIVAVLAIFLMLFRKKAPTSRP